MKLSTHHAKLITILLLYLVLATAHSLIVPLTVGNDEWAHFRYIRFIAEHGRLPLNWTERNEAGYKADAPPLYHLIVAAITSPISPTRTLRLLDTPRSQLADNMLATDALLYTTAQAWPYHGEALMWHIGRGVSIFFGLTLIIITYLTALEIGLRRRQARAATAFIAFTPAVIFHSSVLSYESLSATLTALLLLIALKLLSTSRPHRFSKPVRSIYWFSLGILTGLAIITKYSALLLPLELLFIAFSYYKISNPTTANTNFSPLISHLSPLTSHLSPLISHLSLMALGLLLAVSGWFGFVLYNFNTVTTDGLIVGLINPIFVGDASDTTSVQVASLLFNSAPSDSRPPKPRDYLALTQTFLNSFWSAPIMGQYLPYLPLIFTIFIIVQITNSKFQIPNSQFPIPNSQFLILLFHTFLITPLLLIRVLFSYDAVEVAQGRHLLMPAASAIAILIQLGITNYKLRIKKPTPYSLLPTSYSLLIIHYSLFTWSAFGQVGLALIAYPPPLTVESTPAPPNPLAQLTPALQLNQATWQEKGNSLEVTLEWHALAHMTQDYLIDLQLHNSKGQLVTQMIGQPVYGRYPTRAWEVGDTVTDVYQLPLLWTVQNDYALTLHLLQRNGHPIPNTTPVVLGQVAINSYNRQTFACEPIYFHAQPTRHGLTEVAYRPYATITIFSLTPPYLLASDGSRQIPLISNNYWHTFMVEPNWYQSYHLMMRSSDCGLLHFDIPPRPFTPPPIAHPLAVNFNNEVELIGYDLSTRRIAAGQRLPLTLYWRSLAYMGQDYQIFDNLLDANQQRWGGYDRRPRDGYSTLLWVPGEIITDSFGVPIDPAAPNGIYTLDVGLYQITAEGATSLPIINSEQKSVRLGPIKVGGAPAEVILSQAAPQINLNQSFADSMTLLGYDLTQNDTTLQLTLYWQAIDRPTADYTTFVHLRDATNHNAAQQDSPPGQGRYPTSLWDKSDTIAQNVTLSLDNITPGHYQLVIGLYDSVTGNRLPLANSPQNELSLSEIIK